MKYNDNNMRTDYIKYLLGQSHIPTITVWKRGRFVVADVHYIYNNMVVVAIKNGIPRESDEIDPTTNNRYSQDQWTDSFFKNVQEYHWGEQVHGLTLRYMSKDAYWSKLDHYVLGMYLRALRDIKGEDYLWAYNCWDGSTFEQSLKNLGGNQVSLAQHAQGLKTATVPIVPNQDYTIFIDCQTEVISCTAFIDHNKLVRNELIHPVIYGCLRVNQPVKYRVNWTGVEQDSYKYVREFFTLLIQVPYNCKRIIVLEGDYTDRADMFYGHFNPNDSVKVAFTESPFESEAFNDRLFEFLVEHPIGKDQFEDSIKFVQRTISSMEFFNIRKKRLEELGIPNPRYTEPYTDGVWDENMQRWIRQVFGDDKLMIAKFGKRAVTLQNGEVVKEIEEILRGVMANA